MKERHKIIADDAAKLTAARVTSRSDLMMKLQTNIKTRGAVI